MSKKCSLDLGRIDVDTAGNDHVLGAIGNEQMALTIEVADVTHPKETLCVERIDAEGLTVEVLSDGGWRTNPDLAGLADRQVSAETVADPDIDVLVCDAARTGLA